MHHLQEELLHEHNHYRQLHQAPPLSLGPLLVESAQGWADRLIDMDSLTNSDYAINGSVGESICAQKGGVDDFPSGKDIAQYWYQDIEEYNFENHTGQAGSFTQMVWKNTDKVGFGMAHKNGKRIVVAHYYPPGNVEGEFENNVFPFLESFKRLSTDSKDDPLITSTKVITEIVKDPSGQMYKTKKEVSEYINEQGHTEYRVKEFEPDQISIISKAMYKDSSSDSDEGKKGDSSTLQRQKKKDKIMKEYRAQFLKTHNFYRKQHGVPQLKLNKELNELAQNWADHLSRQTRLSNSTTVYNGNRLGENIASRWSERDCDFPAADVVNRWYTEEKNFNYNEEASRVTGIGNFTQMVWKNSKEIGVGKAKFVTENLTKVVIVCYYHPAGNVLRCFKHNVPRPLQQQKGAHK